ncbi:MAG TPA: tetratricopeptide repeat protein [Candidatus Gastranaerophilaceae bacterium]|nr:tetratricopeptide repeat protein [Candidatus Gastranaerophilaceae bacterium]HPT41742.1 tetratricopeptide repeat protein [Candidatus Gastranaerophilaceae bacterium]
MKKSFLIFSLLLISLIFSGAQRSDIYVIDAQKNASMHNNLGAAYMSEQNYFAAIQEYKIAISLNPNSQASAVYYNNLGEAYMMINQSKWAQDCFQRAIKIYPLNFVYYQNLVKCFQAQKCLDYQLKTYLNKPKTSFNTLMIGLIYIEKGQKKQGIIKLDEFCSREPKLIITSAVKDYLNQITQNY